MKKTKQTFQEFVQEFETLLKKRYGIEINDCTDEAYLKQCYDGKETADDVVEQLATKYDLDRKDRNAYGF